MFASIRTGLLLGLRWPLVLLSIWGLQLLLAVPAAVAMGSELARSFGGTLAEDRMLEGFDSNWYAEFSESARGLVASFRPSLIKGGPFFQNLEQWLDGTLFGVFPGLLGVAGAFAAIWLFFLGGLLPRYTAAVSRGATTTETDTVTKIPTGPAAVIRDGGRFFFRFVRLLSISTPLYYLIYRLHGWFYEGIEERTRDSTVEGSVLMWTLAALAAVALLLTLVHLIFTYAKIATVKDDRRSMFLAAGRGALFVLKNPTTTLTLHISYAVVAFILLLLYHTLAPGVGQSTWLGVGIAFAVSQAFLILKLYLRLSRLAAETALYCSRS